MITRFAAIGLLLVGTLATGQTTQTTQATTSASTSGPMVPVSPVPKDDGQWTMPIKNYHNVRYSELTEINAQNVANLKVAWTFSTGVERGHEEAPLVVGDTMYVVTPYPNVLYALDLKNNGAMKWKYNPYPEAAAQGVACCDVVCRGCVYYEGKIYYNTLDCHTVCVDAKTGTQKWKVKTGEITKGETTTMAPLVAKGKVLVGNSGGELGVRGWIVALDANDGHEIYRCFNTGPDEDCKIGAKFHPFYPRGRTLA